MRLVAWSALLAVASGAMAADVVDVPFFDAAGNRPIGRDTLFSKRRV